MLLRAALLGTLGYLGYKGWERSQVDKNGVAFAKGEPDGPFRNAGPESTASHDAMDERDEALDETFPASDATAKY